MPIDDSNLFIYLLSGYVFIGSTNAPSAEDSTQMKKKNTVQSLHLNSLYLVHHIKFTVFQITGLLILSDQYD